MFVQTGAICLETTLKICDSAPPLGLEPLTFGYHNISNIKSNNL